MFSPMQAIAKITTSVAVVSVRPTVSNTNGSTNSPANAISNGMYFCGGRIAYSNFWMRSPNRPRGRNSNTSTISRYMEASLAGGRK